MVRAAATAIPQQITILPQLRARRWQCITAIVPLIVAIEVMAAEYGNLLAFGVFLVRKTMSMEAGPKRPDGSFGLAYLGSGVH